MYIADAHCDTLYAWLSRTDPSTLQATRSALEQGRGSPCRHTPCL